MSTSRTVIDTSGTGYTPGDMFYVNASGVVVKLPIGTVGHILTQVAGFPAWSSANNVGTPTEVTLGAAYTILTTDYLILVSNSVGTFPSIYLPAAPSVGDRYEVKNMGESYDVEIDGNGNTVDGVSSATISYNESGTWTFSPSYDWVRT